MPYHSGVGGCHCDDRKSHIALRDRMMLLTWQIWRERLMILKNSQTDENNTDFIELPVHRCFDADSRECLSVEITLSLYEVR